MSEWWTYGIADLVLFTPDTYFRMFESHHRAWWPMQLAGMAMAAVMLLYLWRSPARGGRVIAMLLAASWAWVGWAFLHVRFAPIFWIADWYAVAFFLQALLLFIYGLSIRKVEFETGKSVRTGVGISILLTALLAMPAIAWLTGRGWMQAELFAMTPDATALATLGLLLLARGRVVITLAVIPATWCIVSAATLWVLESPGAMILLAGALLATALTIRSYAEVHKLPDT